MKNLAFRSTNLVALALVMTSTVSLASAQIMGGPIGNGRPPTSPNSNPPLGDMTTATRVAALNAVVVIGDGGTRNVTNGNASSADNDLSALLVTNNSTLNVVNLSITSTGNSSSEQASAVLGLNAAVIANKSGKLNISGGTISSTGAGGNGLFAQGSGSSISMIRGTISTSGLASHALIATNGATVTAKDVDMLTTNAKSAAIATDRGGGSVTVFGGKVSTGGVDSPGVFSTGDIQLNGVSITSKGSVVAVVEGSGRIQATNATMTSTTKGGVFLYQAGSGDPTNSKTQFTMSGGSLSAKSGALFSVANTSATIRLTGASLTSTSGTLLSAASGKWGRSGANGGQALLFADGQVLDGSIIADSISSATVTLKNSSTLAGAITNASLSLDDTSKWIVTGNSSLQGFASAATISGDTITNVVGNGFTVTYNPRLQINQSLGARSYSLSGGGVLVPRG